jgi:hypothetical protein
VTNLLHVAIGEGAGSSRAPVEPRAYVYLTSPKVAKILECILVRCIGIPHGKLQIIPGLNELRRIYM